MSNVRVPERDDKFDNYIRNTTETLEAGTPSGAIRLGLSMAQQNEWVGYRDHWIELYPKYTNISTRTSVVTKSKNDFKSEFRAFTKAPLQRMEASENLTTGDRLIFNLPERDRTLTRRGAITDIPIGNLVGKGGGMLEVRARRGNDANRCSKHPLADAVEFRYHLAAPESNPLTTAPEPMLCTNVLFSKAALWRVNLGSAAQGKRVMGYLRWVNLSNPANNSGWSNLISAIVA
jgi:hypothetical protein